MSTATSTPTATDTWRPTNWEAEETPKDRLFRKLKEQPVVPAGERASERSDGAV